MDIFEALQKHGLNIKSPSKRVHQNQHHCYGCIFNGEYRDMGACVSLCERVPDLLGAIKAHSQKDQCKYYITMEDVIALQNAIVQADGSDDT